ncbi:MAG TPA: thiamine diphosphokinase [Bacteroidetes bacterium]|nr:thiamine diphosphokinase [Bacteroidota bacterium]
MRVLIIANGERPAKSLFLSELNKADILIAADGGALTCLDYEIKPDVVIGDMDSFHRKAGLHLNIIVDPDQETNDLEKALNYSFKAGGRYVTVLGATGSRLDQTLKNISVMAQLTSKFKDIVFKDSHGWMKILPRSYSLKTKPNTLISLFPVSGRVDGIKTTGLEYPLNSEPLENGVRDGSSNRATHDEITISHQNGILLLMVYENL